MGMGVLSDEGLEKLIKNKSIKTRTPYRNNHKEINSSQIQPSSLDLKIGGGYIYNMPSSEIPRGSNFEKFLTERCNSFNTFLDPSHFLHKGKIYVAPILEELNLPDYLCGRTNPKSSSGRSDVHVRILTGKGREFDKIPSGYKGKLWIEIFPRSFDLELREGDSLSQLRIQDNPTKSMSIEELNYAHRHNGLIINKNSYPIKQSKFEENLKNGFFPLTINLKGKIKGYIAKPNAPRVNWIQRATSWKDYFDEIHLNKFGEYIIPENAFCVFGTQEMLKIPADYCAEMIDIKTSVGEFRSHYAGFFDPGFTGQIVAEVRNLGAPFSFTHGQVIAGVDFFNLQDKPIRTYGQNGLNTSYQGQKGIRLGKHFLSK
ncbi:2'-deoxycytidine 5'-triphosphate deaminase [archaeon]|nr:2'-deoxycytidine 5'-triphosphate deaminase [archaeon]